MSTWIFLLAIVQWKGSGTTVKSRLNRQASLEFYKQQTAFEMMVNERHFSCGSGSGFSDPHCIRKVKCIGHMKKWHIKI